MNFISKQGLKSSYKVLKKIVDNFENDRSWYQFPKYKFYCEPNLAKRRLNFTVSEKKNYKKLKLRMNVLAYADGEKNLAQISKIINQPINKIIKELKILVKNKVLKIS